MCVLVFGGTKRNALHLKRPVINQSGLQLRGFLPSDKKKSASSPTLFQKELKWLHAHYYSLYSLTVLFKQDLC